MNSSQTLGQYSSNNTKGQFQSGANNTMTTTQGSSLGVSSGKSSNTLQVDNNTTSVIK